MKTVLVTGGCGCLGSWIIKLLIENNDKVICLDTSKSINRLKLIFIRIIDYTQQFND